MIAWRLHEARFSADRDRGEGAYRVGGRWNSRGARAVYCARDPATSILEVAVHKGFRALDTARHGLTAMRILDPAAIHVVHPHDSPNARWLRPGIPIAGQQEFGDRQIKANRFMLIPSTVSTQRWNLVFIAGLAEDAYEGRPRTRSRSIRACTLPAPHSSGGYDREGTSSRRLPSSREASTSRVLRSFRSCAAVLPKRMRFSFASAASRARARRFFTRLRFTISAIGAFFTYPAQQDELHGQDHHPDDYRRPPAFGL